MHRVSTLHHLHTSSLCVNAFMQCAVAQCASNVTEEVRMNLFRFAETHWHPDTGSPSVLTQTDLPRSHGEPPRYPVTAASALVVRALVRQHPSTHRTALPA